VFAPVTESFLCFNLTKIKSVTKTRSAHHTSQHRRVDSTFNTSVRHSTDKVARDHTSSTGYTRVIVVSWGGEEGEKWSLPLLSPEKKRREREREREDLFPLASSRTLPRPSHRR